MAVLGDARGKLLHELGLHFHEVRGGAGRVGLGEVVPVKGGVFTCSRVHVFTVIEKKDMVHTL